MLLAPAASASAAPQAKSFGFDNITQRFKVPAGVNQVHLTAWGGSGGGGGSATGIYAAPGGLGAKLDADLIVRPGDTLFFNVGGRGQFAYGQTPGPGATAGGSNRRGGTGGTVNNRDFDGTAGGGGGGATTVIDAAGQTVLVAGGGGGGGGGGALAGNNGGQGGDAGWINSLSCDPANGPGTYGNGAGGGAGGTCGRPQNGPAGIGGAGEAPGLGGGTGGGGGGGYNGGNGGSAGSHGGGGGGGGGAGTSFWAGTAANIEATNGGPGFGGLVVSWDPAPPTGVRHERTLGAGDHFTVPDGVTELTILATGAAGGYGSGGANHVPSRPGYGAAFRGRVPVKPRDQLAIETGGRGGNGVWSVNGESTPLLGGFAGQGGGGRGGSVVVGNGTGDENVLSYIGGTGGGGGGATRVINTTQTTTLLTAGGGGGGGGRSTVGSPGLNGGPGGNAGGPLVSGSATDGDGFWGSGGHASGTANGAGGRFATAPGADGENAANSTEGNARGTGGGGGAGVRGGGAGQQCTGYSCALAAGGGGAGGSGWTASARDVTLGNSLTRAGEVKIEWIGRVDTSIALDASAQTVNAGSPVTLNATLTGADSPAGSTPTGTVYFIDEEAGSSIGGAILLNGGRASVTTTLSPGTHHIYVSYLGDGVFAGSRSQSLTASVLMPLFFKVGELPTGELGTRYSARLTATGGVAPYTWITDGDEPGGIDLDNATGELSGIPKTAGTNEFVVSVIDARGQRVDRRVSLTFTVPEKLAASPTPTPLANAPVTTAPRLELVGQPRTLSGDRVLFTVRCTGATCAGEATGMAQGKAVAAARFTLAAGAQRTIRMRLNRTGRSMMARKHRLRMKVTVRARAARPTGTMQITLGK